MFKFISCVAVAVTLALSGMAGAANAAIIQADIRAELSIFGTARVFETVGAAVGAGAELDLSHEIANPGSWVGGVIVDIDPVAGTVSVTGTDSFEDYPVDGIDSANFDSVNVFITNILFDDAEELVGLAFVADALLYDHLGNGYIFHVSSTADSISLTWQSETEEIYVWDGSSTVLLYGTAPVVDVPAPMTLALFAGGLVVLGRMRRRSA